MTAPARRTRVIVALDAAEPSALSLDMAYHLVDLAAAELVGVFIEDQRLLAHAASRLAREIAFSGEARSLAADTLERQLRVRAAEVRRRFEAGAADLGLRPGFEVLRGEVVAELVRAATQAQALVVCLSPSRWASAWRRDALRALASTPIPALLFAHEGWRTGHGIVATIGALRELETVLATALRIAQRSLTGLTIVIGVEQHAERRAAAERATALAAAVGVDIRALVTAAALTVETVLHAAQGARLTVLAHPADAPTTELIAALVARGRSPLLVVGESQQH